MVQEKQAETAQAALASQQAQVAPAPQTGLGGGWAALRQCESGGRYDTNTGNGFYGAYQYDIGTWGDYGGYHLASEAPPGVQDAKAQETYAARGSSPWPQCGRFL